MAVSKLPPTRPKGRLAQFLEGDIWFSFSRSPIVVLSTLFLFIAFLSATFAPWVASKGCRALDRQFPTGTVNRHRVHSTQGEASCP